MADTPQCKQPKTEMKIKIGRTTYIVSAVYASKGVTASEKIKRLLDKDTDAKI